MYPNRWDDTHRSQSAARYLIPFAPPQPITMKRDLSQLKNHVFDAIVIGGGIHGSTIFHQLAEAGLRVALIEKDDFGGATSANSLKILHSGLRYLQHLNFKRIRESIRSRKYFMAMAPHLIQPMPCIMPTYGFGLDGKATMALAIAVFDLLGWDRNQGAPPANRVQRGRSLSREECLAIGPGIKRDGLTGAALWYDDLILSTERMALCFIKEAMRHNAVCANYLRADAIKMNDRRVTGVQVTDRFGGGTFVIEAPVVINAAGPWIPELQRLSGQKPSTEDLAKAVNIVVDRRLFPGHGVGLAGSGDYVDQDAAVKRGKRLFFFAPWLDKTIIGTTYHYAAATADDHRVTAVDIDEVLAEINSIYPLAALTRKDVIFSHAGLVPAHQPKGKDRQAAAPQVVKHSHIIDHGARDGIAGLLSIEGVKYTTAPAVARDLRRLISRRRLAPGEIAPAPANCPTRRPLSFADHQLIARYAARYPHLAATYGDDQVDICAIIAVDPSAAESLRFSPPLLKAEVIHAVQAEMALRLIDVVLRRTNCATTGCPTEAELLAIAEVMAGALGWDAARIDREVADVFAYFRDVLGID